MAERAAQITYPMSILDDRDRNELFGRIAGVETELKDSIADLDEKVETYKTEHEQDVEDINQNIVDNVETLNETIVNTQTLLQQNIDSNTADIEDNTNRIYANEKNIAEIEKTISTGAGMELDYEDSQLSLLASDGTALSTVTIVGGGVSDNVAFEDDGSGNVSLVSGDSSLATDITEGNVTLSDAIDSSSDVTGGVAATPLAVKNAVAEAVSQANSYSDGKLTEANAYTDGKVTELNADIEDISNNLSTHTHTAEDVNGGTFTGNYEFDGLLSVNGYNPMLGTLADDEYYGMLTPAASDADFIRTTYAGILPYGSAASDNGNSSVLGTQKWPFKQVVTNNLYVGGRKYGENVYLWSSDVAGNTPMHMNGSQTIQFTDPDTGEKIGVSSMPTGIVLIFSGYDSENQVAKDTSWSSHFVPKKLVQIYGEDNTTHGQLFIMGINSGLSEIGAKYLYLREYGISGSDTNADSGTNGFIYNNGNYVLRYVIGV